MVTEMPSLDARMTPLVDEAWNVYKLAESARLPALVRPSIPVLFFGDHERYFESPLRVVTVGLNPSDSEFPSTDPFLRFPAARRLTSESRDPTAYLRALSDYFRVQPYDPWFKPAFEGMLGGMNASFYGAAASTALHSDICSPLATKPTWSHLKDERLVLGADGIEIWHRLMESLQPDVIIVSVARQHLRKIRFRGLSPWRTVHTVERSNPFKTEVREIEVCSHKPTLLVFGQAANLPFGTVSGYDKRKIGVAIAEAADAR
jgi:hypothetical protein